MRTISREIVGTFIFSKDKQLLLGKSRKGGVYQDQWIIPGGGIEDDETKLEAAIREMLEEVGIDITQFKVTPIDDSFTGESEKVLRDTHEKVLVKMTFYNYLVEADKNAAEIPIYCEDDIVEAAWYPISELSKLDLSLPTKMSLEKLGYL